MKVIVSFYIRLGSCRPPYGVDFSANERSPFAFWPSRWRHQLLNIGTVSFTNIKAAWSKCLSLQTKKKTFLFEYAVYAINRSMFFTYKWFWFEILEYYAKTRL